MPKGSDLVPVGKTILVPIAFYSKRYKTVSDIPTGATIAIPNDPANEARTLLLLETTGLIKLKPECGLQGHALRHCREPRRTSNSSSWKQPSSLARWTTFMPPR